jgi:Ca2+-transporting ATPase
LGTSEGVSILLTVAAVLWWTVRAGYGEGDIRAITFTSLVFGNVALIFANLSRTHSIWSTLRSPNRALWWVISGAFALLAAALYLPYVQQLFRFSPLHPLDLAISLAAGLFAVAVLESLKLVHRRKVPSQPNLRDGL